MSATVPAECGTVPASAGVRRWSPQREAIEPCRCACSVSRALRVRRAEIDAGKSRPDVTRREVRRSRTRQSSTRRRDNRQDVSGRRTSRAHLWRHRDRVGGDVFTGDSIGALLVSKGFNLKSKPSVELSATKVLAKGNSWPTTIQLAPRRPDRIVPMSHDRRWLWPHLRRQDAGTSTATRFSTDRHRRRGQHRASDRLRHRQGRANDHHRVRSRKPQAMSVRSNTAARLAVPEHHPR